MVDLNDKKLMGLLIITAKGFVTEPRTYKRKEKTKTTDASMDKKDR